MKCNYCGEDLEDISFLHNATLYVCTSRDCKNCGIVIAIPLGNKETFSFKKSEEVGEKVVWLCFKNGMINLNAIVDRYPGIIGKNLAQAISDYLKEEVGE